MLRPQSLPTSFCNQSDTMWAYSGQHAGIMGSYRSCELLPDAQYCIVIPDDISAVLGLCVPNLCNVSEIGDYILANPLINTSSALVDLFQNKNFVNTTSLPFVSCTTAEAVFHDNDAAIAACMLFLMAFVLLCSWLDYMGYARRPGTPMNASLKGAVSPPPFGNNSIADGGANTQGTRSPSAQSKSDFVLPYAGSYTPQPNDYYRSSVNPLTSPADNSTPQHRYYDLPPPDKATTEEGPPFCACLNKVLPPWLVERVSIVRSFAAMRFYDRHHFSNVFGAIRVLAWLWIVSVDVYHITKRLPGYENPSSHHVHTNPLFAIVWSATVPISAFLFMSGFIVAHSIDADLTSDILYPYAQRDASKKAALDLRSPDYGAVPGSKTSDSATGRGPIAATLVWYVKHFGKRYLRLTPLIGFVMLFARCAIAWLGSGPFWSYTVNSKFLTTNCRETWWANLLYVNNIFPADAADRCMPWTYYFALDVQFYVFLAPALVFTYHRVSHRFCFLVIAFMCLLSSILNGVEDAMRTEHWEGFAASRPWLRATPFLIGVGLALLHREVSQREDEDTFFSGPDVDTNYRRYIDSGGGSSAVYRFMQGKRNRLGMIWIAVAVIILMVVWEWRVEVGSDGTRAAARLQRAVSPVFLSLSFTSIVLPLMFGYGGLLRRFLYHRLWQPLSRLVLPAYLIHPIVIMVYNGQMTHQQDLSVHVLVYNWMGHVCWALILAFMLHLCVERPLSNLIT